MIKISVIVPVYNMEKYLEKCLDSLVNQTLKEIEIIAVNDGSKDKSINILKKYSKKYKNIKIYDHDNQGISKTRNFGIEKATGEYIAFIDSDDYVDTRMFEIMYKKAKKDNLDIVVCDYYNYYENKNKIEKFKIVDFKDTTISENKSLIFQINPSPWNKIYKKELFEVKKYRFPIGIKYEDLGYIPILLTEANRIGKVNIPLNYYLIRGNSETTTIDERVFDIFKILDILYEYFENKNMEKTKEVEFLFISKLTMYNLQQKFNINKKCANEFINKSFDYLNDKYPYWKINKYFIKTNKLKIFVKSSKWITKIYAGIGEQNENK